MYLKPFRLESTNAFLSVYLFRIHYCLYIPFPHYNIFLCALHRMALLPYIWQLKRTTLKWWNISWRMEPTKAQLLRWGVLFLFYIHSYFLCLYIHIAQSLEIFQTEYFGNFHLFISLTCMYESYLFFLHTQKAKVNCSGNGEKSRVEIQPDSFDIKISSTGLSEPRIFTFSLCPFLLSASWRIFWKMNETSKRGP